MCTHVMSALMKAGKGANPTTGTCLIWSCNCGYEEKGTSTGANANNTLSDTTKTWKKSQWIRERPADRAILKITEGTGQSQERTIVDNTLSELVIDQPWTTVPDNTSKYSIQCRRTIPVGEIYRYTKLKTGTTQIGKDRGCAQIAEIACLYCLPMTDEEKNYLMLKELNK